MRERLNHLEVEFEAANVRMGEATWNTYSGEGPADLDGAQRQLAQVFTNPRDRELVEGLLATADGRKETLLARRLGVWRNCFNGSTVDNVPEIYTLKNRLQQRIASFQFELDGRPIPRSELQKILRNEPDRERRHLAWRAIAALAAANREDLRRLISLRNHKARELGYRDYVDLVLQVQEIDEPWLKQTLERVAAESRPVYAALIQSLADKIRVASISPWDVPYAMRQGFQLPDSYFPADKALERLRATATRLGFNVDALPIRTLIRDIPFGGYNVAVKIPSDTRFLVNPSEGQSFYTTTFHEFGHSLQAVFTGIDWPILKEYEWVMGAHTAAYSEGMAETLGEFARRTDWLQSVAGVPEEGVERYLTVMLPAQMVIRLFELLFNMRLELSAYAESSQNMPELERELTREIRLLRFPEEDPSQWEANTWYTSYPVYWQNYILASVIASQAHETITERFGLEASANPDLAAYLRENFYASGNAFTWWERVRRGTGKPLNPEPYLRRVRGGSGLVPD